MILKKVEISNVLGVKSANLTFKENVSAFVVQSAPDCPIRSSFCTAIELIVSSKYAYLESLVNLKDIQGGYVSITFQLPRKVGEVAGGDNGPQNSDDDSELDNAPSTSQQALAAQQRRQLRKNRKRSRNEVHEIIALRDFRTNASQIEFTIDNESKQFCSPAAFHGRFRTNVEYLFPFMDKIYESRSGNLFSCILRNINCMWQESHELFELYEKVCSNQRPDGRDNKFLDKLTKCFLHSYIAKSVIQKRYVMKVCRDVRTIFEFITCDEYSIWFVISYQGQLVGMEDITIEELDMNAIETRIQVKGNKYQTSLISWNETNQVVRELLLTALDLALAFTCKRRFVVIRHLEAIQKHQIIELSTAAYLQKTRQDKNMDWTHKNYLQRIIDVCNAMKILAVIEYTAGLIIPPLNANIIKCIKACEPFEQSWSMILYNPEPCTVENIVKRIEQSLL